MVETGTSQILVIAGPTGSGESTVTNEIIKQSDNNIVRLVTATTRAPRAHETEGVDYYFFSKQDFLAKKESGDILECTYIENRDTYYGSYRSDLEHKLASGKIVVVNSDIVGTTFYKKHYNATTIFIMPESIAALRARLQKREPDMSDAELARRIKNAEAEIRTERSFYDFVVENADGRLQEAVRRVFSIMKEKGFRV